VAAARRGAASQQQVTQRQGAQVQGGVRLVIKMRLIMMQLLVNVDHRAGLPSWYSPCSVSR
jgi:lipopolysaccharide export system protein LptC